MDSRIHRPGLGLPSRLLGLALAALLLAACGGRSNADPLAENQYAIDQLGMRDAWRQTKGEGTVVAVIDTGADLDHPDLKANLVAGYDFVDDDSTPQDLNGHGTHVAGTVAAVADNGIGVTGMAPEAKIMPLRVLDGKGFGTSEDVAAAIDFAVDHGADVINLSLGGSSALLGRIYNKVDPANQAIVAADKAGVVVVAAAGNDATFLTAFDPETPVLVVNATNEAGTSALFSNFGDPRAVSAPGARILSTSPTTPTAIWPDGTNGYSYLDGTSMACPHVAGVAALMSTTDATPAEIREALIDTAVNPQEVPFLGAGIVQADDALRALRR